MSRPSQSHVLQWVFPMTDDAAVDVASVPYRHRRRRLVDTDSDVREASQVVRGGRTLVVVGAQTQVDPVESIFPDQEWYSRGGISHTEGEVEVACAPEPPVPAVAGPRREVQRQLKGAYRSAIRLALTGVDQGRSDGARCWKLFLLLPRLLLRKPPRGGLLPKKQLQRRFRIVH